MEVAGTVAAVVGGAQPDGPYARRPAGPVARPDGQRPELVKPEAAVRIMAGHVLDAVQLPNRLGHSIPVLDFLNVIFQMLGYVTGAVGHNAPLFVTCAVISGGLSEADSPMTAAIVADYYGETGNALNYGSVYQWKTLGSGLSPVPMTQPFDERGLVLALLQAVPMTRSRWANRATARLARTPPDGGPDTGGQTRVEHDGTDHAPPAWRLTAATVRAGSWRGYAQHWSTRSCGRVRVRCGNPAESPGHRPIQPIETTPRHTVDPPPNRALPTDSRPDRGTVAVVVL